MQHFGKFDATYTETISLDHNLNVDLESMHLNYSCHIHCGHLKASACAVMLELLLWG